MVQKQELLNKKARLQRFDELVNTESIKIRDDVDISLIGSRLGKKGS